VLEEGLAPSRARAQALIRSGAVLVDDAPMDKPGTRVADSAALRVRGGGLRFVSRGGEKLAGALEDLGLDPAGRVWLDVGASTGGFTDCLLQAGARAVVALDVGYGQLHARLRSDPRVSVLERTHAARLEPGSLPRAVDAVVVDVSFIAARRLLEPIAAAAPGAPVLILVKPQFELGREHVGRGGVVRDEALRRAAVEAVRVRAGELGYAERGRADSRVAGPKGNREIFLWLERREADQESAGAPRP